jgi:hypothetical protein
VDEKSSAKTVGVLPDRPVELLAEDLCGTCAGADLTPALPPLRPPPALPRALPSAGAALALDDTALELELEALELEELELELFKLELAKNADGVLAVEVFVEELFHRGLLLVDESEDATE